MTLNHKHVVWLYYGDHLQHPFIRLGLSALRDVGFGVTVCDATTNWQSIKEYEHLTRYWPEWMPKGTWLQRRQYDLAVIKMVVRMFQQTIVRRPGQVVATMPQAMLAAWVSSLLIGAKFIYYPFELYGEQSQKASLGWALVEKLILKFGVDVIVTQNEARAQVYVQERGARVAPVIIHNYKPLVSVAQSDLLHRHLDLPSNTKIVLYEGYIMRGRWLDKLIAAAAYLSPDVRLVLMGPGWDGYGKPLIAELELTDRVVAIPAVPQQDLLRYVTSADVGVIIYDGSIRNNYLCEPGKLSDYVIGGIPVVAPDFPTIGPVVRQYCIGQTFSDSSPECIAKTIQDVLSAPNTQWQTALENARQHLVWETQRPIFLSLFN